MAIVRRPGGRPADELHRGSARWIRRRPVSDAPGTTARFETAPLDAGHRRRRRPDGRRARQRARCTTLRAGSADARQLVLFFKLYDVAPDGTITLTHRVIAPVRLANLTVPVQVQLAGIVHRFPKGHRMALAVSTGDAAYKGNNLAGPVQISTSKDRPGCAVGPRRQRRTGRQGRDRRRPVPSAARASGPSVSTSARRCGARCARRSSRSAVRRVATVRGADLNRAIPISFQGVSAANATVKITMRLKSGRTVVDTRRYRTCKAAKR